MNYNVNESDNISNINICKVGDLQNNRNLYEDEINHADRLNTKTTYMLSVLTIIGSGEILVIQEILPIKLTFWAIIYYTLCLISLITFVYSIWLFIQVCNVSPYSYVNISAINKTCSRKYKEMAEKNFPQDIIGKFMELMFIKMLSEQYFNCALQNRLTNIEKLQNQQKLTQNLIYNFIALFVNFVGYIIIHSLKGGV